LLPYIFNQFVLYKYKFIIEIQDILQFVYKNAKIREVSQFNSKLQFITLSIL